VLREIVVVVNFVFFGPESARIIDVGGTGPLDPDVYLARFEPSMSEGTNT
jgi:hypothetical protein